MLPRIEIRTDGLDPPTEVELADDERLLVGRSPDLQRVSPAATGRWRTVSIASPAVSSNHVVLWRDGGAVCLHDPGSRNGTWLRLPPGTTVTVDGGGASAPLPLSPGSPGSPVSIELSRRQPEERLAGEPADARWSGPGDFAAGVAQALTGWMRRQGLGAAVQVSAGLLAVGEPRSLEEVPLADGNHLIVRPTETTDASWPQLLAQVWRYVIRQNSLLSSEQELREEGLVLASEAIRRAHHQVLDAARRGVRILLLLGPSGAGKEALARSFYRHSGASGPFVTTNCSMFSRDRLQAELFGAVKGAWTDGPGNVGAVERAAGGVLFLDEIGDLVREVQPMLLRFVETGEYQRMGDPARTRSSEARLVCATNKDLRAGVSSGEFRLDLWFRLSVHVVDVPPLSERPEDVIGYLKMRRLGPGLSAHEALHPAAVALLSAHPWPGNFRELANLVERLPPASSPGSISVEQCRTALAQGTIASSGPGRAPARAGALPADAWPRLAAQAAAAYAEDFGGSHPGSWDEVKTYIERYLKPLLFVHLGSGADADADSVELAQVRAFADRLDADRGTASKQIERYVERFRSRG